MFLYRRDIICAAVEVMSVRAVTRRVCINVTRCSRRLPAFLFTGVSFNSRRVFIAASLAFPLGRATSAKTVVSVYYHFCRRPSRDDDGLEKSRLPRRFFLRRVAVDE